MLTLQAEQLDALEQLDRAAFGVALRRGLGDAWPLVAARLGPGFDGLVASALAGAQQRGLPAPWQAAGYANLCCVWGAGFDAKPGFEWARDILAARERKPELRLHQLVQHTRELLSRGAAVAPTAARLGSATSAGQVVSTSAGRTPSTNPAGVTAAQFDAVLARLPALADAASACGVFVQPPSASSSVVACDLAGVEIEIGQPAGLHEYQLLNAAWRRQPVPPVPHALRLDAAPTQPQTLAALGANERASASRLRLRLQGLAQCDRARHPSVTVDSPQGRLQWRGRDAIALALPLPGHMLPPPDTAIAPELEPALHHVAIETCGVRDHGAPIGPLAVELRVHSAVQTFCEWRIGALPALKRPQQGAPAEPAAIACRLERDGHALDASPWIASWRALHAKLEAGLEQLFGTWVRVGAIEAPRMDAQLAPLQGTASMTWGCRQADISTVFTRLQGRVDMLACAADVTLAGEIAQDGARARVTLRARGRCELRCDLARNDAATPLAAAAAPPLATWRFPFEVDVEPVAGSLPATLGQAAGRPSLGGALTGTAGLRVHAAGGLEWFFTLSCEPAQLAITRADALFGIAGSSRALLPAMVLVDWSSN